MKNPNLDFVEPFCVAFRTTAWPGNARAVAEAPQRLGATFNVIPAGERWLDGSLRPSLEDWIGAGAILQSLSGS